MKSNRTTNSFERKVKKMTLEDYYNGLPEANYPKTEFVNQIVQKCNVSSATAHNWIHGKTKPLDQKHVEMLSEITGIPKEMLWKD